MSCCHSLKLFYFVLCACTTFRTSPVLATSFCQDVIQPFQEYDCSEQSVGTNDGFGLTLEHITQKNHQGAYAAHILFLHTVFLGGEQWFQADSPTPLTAASSNYSVWVANMRTTPYGLGCSYYDPTEMGYWDWCGDEMVNYDFPALVQQLLNAIGNEKFHLVGFSHGARVGIGALTYLFQQAQMVASATFIAPVVYSNNTQAPMLVSIKQAHFTAKAYKTVANFCLRIFAGVTENVMQEPWLSRFMNKAVTSLTGPNCCSDTKAVFQAFTRTNASCTSFKLLDHLWQSMNLGKFQAYDFHDVSKSVSVYGTSYAPSYDVTALPGNIPILVIYGGADTFADPIDVMRLLKELAVIPEVHYLPDYAHADFLFSRSLEEDVNQRVLQFIADNNPAYCDRVKCFSPDKVFAGPGGVFLPVFPSSLVSLTNFGFLGLLGRIGR